MKKFFYLFGILIWGLISSCSKSNEVPIAQQGSVVESVADCDLISVLNAYNDSLYLSKDFPRMYDPLTNVVSIPKTRAVNTYLLLLKDAKGAYKGAKRGFAYGMTFSPSGAVAGAAVGGILVGAIYSGVYYWSHQAGESIQANVLTSLIETDSIFTPQPLYQLATNIESELIASAPLDVNLCFGEDVQTIGIVHNLLLDQMLGESYSLNDTDVPADDGNDGEPEPPSVYVGYIDELFGDEFSADMVASEVFQEDFSDLVEQLFDESQDDSSMQPAEDIPTVVLNLCSEAAIACADNMDNVASIVNYYYSQVENSGELNETDKMCLRAGLSVMVYSASYWLACEAHNNSGVEE